MTHYDPIVKEFCNARYSLRLGHKRLRESLAATRNQNPERANRLAIQAEDRLADAASHMQLCMEEICKGV